MFTSIIPVVEIKTCFGYPEYKKRPARPILEEIKNAVIGKWGVVDLVDILIEADRQVNFTRSFRVTGQKQILNANQARVRSILSLLSLGTCTGLKRIHAAARPDCTYSDLLYFRQRYVGILPPVPLMASIFKHGISKSDFRF